ncbi:MAG: BMP family ABC transporter substrate-binding protein [Lachnospiraceae bacterium]|nr:BMP family ABC transporter substrate-binding protein [Lachnospiraceae bacterium]
MSRGAYPYLPVLEEVIGKGSVTNAADLGIVDIPTEWIVGTKTRGRADAFACDFMPLLPERSEFANKWKQLYHAQLEEGIRDPVRVTSYLNRYYVEEGNKRVSILKYVDAPEVTAHVFHVMPAGADALRDRYMELFAFQRDSGIYFLEFSRPGDTAEFVRLCGRAPGERWEKEERRALHGAFDWFRKVYEALGGKKLSCTAGDALLLYLRVYGYDALRSASMQEIKTALSKIWDEVKLLEEEKPVEVVQEPAAEVKPGLVSRVFAGVPKLPLHVAFVHDRSPETSGWTLSHEMGRRYAERVLQGSIETQVYTDAEKTGAGETLAKAIAEGNTVLFTTSPMLMPASLTAAAEHPEVMIWNCSLNQPHRLVRTYYARMYEAKFIIGAIAGALAENETIGYLADFPIYGQVAGINAFALGAEMVRPGVNVRLEWSGTDHFENALRRLRDAGISLISAQDMAKLNDWHGASFGLARFEGEGSTNLAMPVWDWGVFYEMLLRRILSGQERMAQDKSHKALNYYYGMSAGAVSLQLSDALPEAVKRLARVLEKSVREGICDPFRGRITAQNGSVLAEAHASLPLEEIIDMRQLVSNVEGHIPAVEELSKSARALMAEASGGGAE